MLFRSVVDFGGSGEQTSTLRNAPSGVINTSGDVLLEGLDGVLQNEGRINVASGALFADSLSIEQSGTLSIAAGSTFGKRDNDTYPASQIGTLTNRIGAVIEGAGTIDLGTITVLSPDLGKKGTLTNAGTISPGTATAPGTLTINGNLVLAPTSQLPMDLFGSGSTPAGSDKLVVNGATTLGGSLNVSLASGYTPPVGFSADLGTASDFAGSSGSFSSTSLPPGFTGSVINPPAAPVLTYRISNGAPPPPCAGVCWVGGNGNLWSTDANWNVGHVPLPSDTAYLNLLGGASVPVLLNDARTIAALFSDAGNTLTIASGGSLTLAGHSVLNGDLALQNGGSQIGRAHV